MRYTVTMTIYIDAENDKHAVSKAKEVAVLKYKDDTDSLLESYQPFDTQLAMELT